MSLAGGNKVINGWSVGSFFGDRNFYKGDWLKRAAAAKAGLYGNDAVEAMYPFTRASRPARRSTPASTTTRSPFRPANCPR